MVTADRKRNDTERIRNGRIDDATRAVVRDMAQSSPPKSLDTIKAAGAATEAVLQDHVRRRAYDMWDHEGRPPGNGVSYWVRAEQEILEEARAD